METSSVVCAACRQRKVRCDRQLPSCKFCSDIGTTCCYVQSTRKRGLRAGYVSSLEKRLEKLEQEVTALKSQCLVADSVRGFSTTPLASPGSGNTITTPSPASHHSAPAAVSELEELSQLTLRGLCDTWFERYHPWFPILHRLSLLETLDNSMESLSESPLYIVFKAISAVTLPCWALTNTLNREQREQLSSNFRGQVIMEALGNLSLQSLQALLIITILDYGAGKLSEFWNLVATCKRMGTQLGLRDMVANHCDNFNKLSTIPPRMLQVPSTLIEQEENIRAYWMTELLDSMSSLGAGWNLNISRPESQAWLPCSEIIWAFPETATGLESFGDSEVSSAFSLHLNFVSQELYKVHLFLQQSATMTSYSDLVRIQEKCTTVDESLTKWRRSESTAIMLQPKHHASESAVVMINATFNTAILVTYQRLAFPPTNLRDAYGPWYHAVQRCLDACDSMSEVIRALNDADLENVSPHLIFCIFVAARFFVVHAKLLSTEIPPRLNLLVYGLKVCGQRWHFARRLEKVIRRAITEEQVPIESTSLPKQFYDLHYSSLDIDHALQIWADEEEPITRR